MTAMRSAIVSSARVVDRFDAVVLRSLAQDGEPCGEVGRADVGHEPRLEALAEPVFQRPQVGGRAV